MPQFDKVGVSIHPRREPEAAGACINSDGENLKTWRETEGDSIDSLIDIDWTSAI